MLNNIETQLGITFVQPEIKVQLGHESTTKVYAVEEVSGFMDALRKCTRLSQHRITPIMDRVGLVRFGNSDTMLVGKELGNGNQIAGRVVFFGTGPIQGRDFAEINFLYAKHGMAKNIRTRSLAEEIKQGLYETEIVGMRQEAVEEWRGWLMPYTVMEKLVRRGQEVVVFQGTVEDLQYLRLMGIKDYGSGGKSTRTNLLTSGF